MNETFARIVANELGLKTSQVDATLDLLSSGATIPFVARYRKEATAGLDEVQIAAIWDRWEYLRELGERKKTVLGAIEDQGKLTDELRDRIAVRAETTSSCRPTTTAFRSSSLTTTAW